MFSISRTYKGDIIPKRTKWIYTTSGLGRDAVYAMVSVFLLTFIQEAGYLSSGAEYASMFAVISGLIIGYRVFDAINDPFMGIIIEKVHLKSGKYKPWIFIGSITNTGTVLALFLTPAFCSWCHGWAFVAWFAVFYLLWGMTFTMNDIAFCSMLPSLSSNEQQRAKITSLLMIFENGGSFLTSLLIPMMAKPENLGPKAYWVAAIIICALFVIGQGALFFFCHEREREKKARFVANQPRFKDIIDILRTNKLVRLMAIVIFVWFVSSFIFSGLLQNIFYLSVGYSAGKDLMSYYSFIQVAAIVLPMIFMPKILEKVPKMKVFKVTISLMILSYALFFIYGSPIGNGITLAPTIHFGDPSLNANSAAYATCLFIITFLMFSMSSCVYDVLYLMMENTVEYNQYYFGKKQESCIFSLRPFATKMASSIQVLVTDLALFSTGFIAISNRINEINSDTSITDESIRSKLLEDAIAGAANNLGMTYSMRVWCIAVPAVLLVLTLFLIAKFYDLNEEEYRKICKEIKVRKLPHD